VVKHWILPDLKTQIELGTIRFFPETIPVEITPGHALLEKVIDLNPTGQRFAVPADFILFNTGFVQDPCLFEMAGVTLSGDERAPAHNPETMETNVPGLYVAGTAVAGSQKRYSLFLENTHVHVGKIALALTGRWPERLGTIPERRYETPFEAFQDN
jgi:thioredoxin reductase (NADPH)